MPEQAKKCLLCSKPLRGRSDKKFCSDYCRNNYNNQLKTHANNHVRNINSALSKNRRVLEELLPAAEEIGKATKEKLLNHGFSFKYITHTFTNKKGATYFYCYDYGYLPLDNDWFLIVKRKED
jgi:predicted nucleic acid-binding Zn ribbon protein